MVAAETSRSRAYLQALLRNALLPSFVVLLENTTRTLLPGQATKPVRRIEPETSDEWSEAPIDLSVPVRAMLESAGVAFVMFENQDINDAPVIEAISARPEPVFIYSGFGGAILRRAVFATGKRFLHVHGGYLPDYKGSTTNYFSLLAENKMGASALFLNEEIDSGPVLMRRTFAPPRRREEIDHVYDSAARAKVLVETLRQNIWMEDGCPTLNQNEAGETYFVIHPVLKHLAILGGQDSPVAQS